MTVTDAPARVEPDGYEFGSFDLGLSAENEARAARLHAESIVIDLVYWGPGTYRSFNQEREDRLKATFEASHDLTAVIFDALDLEIRDAVAGTFPELRAAWEASGISGASFPLQVGSERVLVWSAGLLALAERLEWVRKANTAADFRAAKAAGQLAWFGYCQPALAPISRDLSLIERAHDLGLRMLMLTYNDQDQVGAGCTERTDAGVTNFGKRVIQRCNDLGIIVDTGHCGRQTTLDACEFSSAPVVCSHATASAVFQHDRGKGDDELRAIAATGGVIGVVTVPFFLGPVEEASLTTWLDHMDHVAELVGPQHLALGTDWPMPGPKWTLGPFAAWSLGVGFRPEHGMNLLDRNLPGFDDYRDTPNLTRGLVSRGYSDDEIRGILGGNALRVFERVCS